MCRNHALNEARHENVLALSRLQKPKVRMWEIAPTRSSKAYSMLLDGVTQLLVRALFWIVRALCWIVRAALPSMLPDSLLLQFIFIEGITLLVNAMFIVIHYYNVN